MDIDNMAMGTPKSDSFPMEVAPQRAPGSVQRTKDSSMTPSSARVGSSTHATFADQKESDFVRRHIGPDENETADMLEALGFGSLENLISAAVPKGIRASRPLDLGAGLSEAKLLARAKAIASKNKVFRSFIGAGYYDTLTPSVILRNILENPGWYTAYTPYQAEIAQGRLEALLNFQTMVMELTGMDLANASLLDEATAAAEAMLLCRNVKSKKVGNRFFVADHVHPQTIDVLSTRARALGIDLTVGKVQDLKFDPEIFGALVQFPTTDGALFNYEEFIKTAHANESLVVVAADLLSLTVCRSPGELGADVVVGNTQRFGVPMGMGGPHAAYFATRDAFKRLVPGRIVGVSVDAENRPALRLALQTREQHIRREKATSNICTSQVLLAVMAGMYAVYHGPAGLKSIANRVHGLANLLATGLKQLGLEIAHAQFFDTVKIVQPSMLSAIRERSEAAGMNLRYFADGSVGIALDETTELSDVKSLLQMFAGVVGRAELDFDDAAFAHHAQQVTIPQEMRRMTAYLSQPAFNSYHSETEMLRYITRLQSKDLTLANSMIPLGSCTMKLNATGEMIPVTWPEFSKLHPFAPSWQTKGYQELVAELEKQLCEITGFSAVSVQPNAGSQGEYAGLLAIRRYHESRGEQHRNICLIPSSAHGTNPASAVMAGMKVETVKCDELGNIDISDLREKAEQNKDSLSSLMVTYPSTHGVFEETIREICEIIHQNGGQVYMDGANLNALVGLCRPAELGADVCHMNLHKTFCIPHGGGGPGVGPIGVAKHLSSFLPGHRFWERKSDAPGSWAVSAAPWGSAGILVISWAYISMMGSAGLQKATEVAILNANYIAHRLQEHYPILYRGPGGLVAHECILDVRPLKDSAGINVDDVAKRLMDFGFHAPTMSWPVAGTLMVEPTESESKAELDRFCDAMIAIHSEAKEIEVGQFPREDNVLVNAPHTISTLTSDTWSHPYARTKAAFPLPWVAEHKFWTPVARINNPYGDRNLVCSCS